MICNMLLPILNELRFQGFVVVNSLITHPASSLRWNCISTRRSVSFSVVQLLFSNSEGGSSAEVSLQGCNDHADLSKKRKIESTTRSADFRWSLIAPGTALAPPSACSSIMYEPSFLEGNRLPLPQGWGTRDCIRDRGSSACGDL